MYIGERRGDICVYLRINPILVNSEKGAMVKRVR